MKRPATTRSKPEPRTVARLAIQKPGAMTKRGRRDIANWLRSHAAMLMKDGDKYTEGRFTGRFTYV